MKFKFLRIILIISLLIPFTVKGDLIDDINQQIQEQESKRAELERQAQEYQAIINQKQGEIKSLKNQVAIFNARINKIEVEVNITEDDIDQTELEILQLEYGIEDTEVSIIDHKENLGIIIQTIAEFDQISEIEIMLESEDFSDFFNQLNYLDNLQGGVKEKVDSLKSLKLKLGEDKESKEDKKNKLEDLKSQLDAQKYSLANQRSSKENLINYTKGEESEYQKMLANIEEQKKSLLGDLNRLRQQKSAELARLKELQEKPPADSWASLNWFYTQDDPRWANLNIGISSLTMSNYGCAISSVSMVFSKLGTNITPGQLAKEPIYTRGGLIYWPNRWNDIRLVEQTYRTAADWARVDREIGAGYPVIVRIQADGRGGGHYVVVHHKTEDGRYVVHDPLFGSNIYLDSSRVYISNIYETTTSINQMIIYH